MHESPDILVLGGGVIGLTTAYFLAREGAGVKVLERGDFGREASWAGAGILPAVALAGARTPFEFLRARSAALFPDLSRELREVTGIDNGYVRCGGFEFLDVSSGGHRHHPSEWRSAGMPCETLDEAAYRKLEARIAPGLGRINHLPDLAQLRNPRHLHALSAACQLRGVQLERGVIAQGLSTNGKRIDAVKTSAGDIQADQFLVATGAWTDLLLAAALPPLGIHPVRGQIVLLNTGTPMFRHVLVWGSRYLVPRPDGRVLIGSTEEKVGFDKRSTAVAVSELLAFAYHVVPDLAHVQVERCWAGLRPGSPDDMPFLGRVPGFDNLFIAAGHFRSGIQLSPATALVMKECLLGQPPSIPLDDFRVDRHKCYNPSGVRGP
jgi:glycine oxidase